MSHRHFDYNNYPPRFPFPHQDGLSRTPIARREPYNLDVSSHLSKTMKFNDISPNSYEVHYPNTSASDLKRNINQDYLKLNKDYNHLKG